MNKPIIPLKGIEGTEFFMGYISISQKEERIKLGFWNLPIQARKEAFFITFPIGISVGAVRNALAQRTT